MDIEFMLKLETFTATVSNGDSLKLEKSGFFGLNRSLSLNDVELFRIKNRVAIYNGRKYRLNGRNFVCEDWRVICSVDRENFAEPEQDLVLSWDHDDEELPVTALALYSFVDVDRLS
ncbi:MAG: hypothetical protein AAGI88_05340 [Pseudomonadota bacterium]